MEKCVGGLVEDLFWVYYSTSRPPARPPASPSDRLTARPTVRSTTLVESARHVLWTTGCFLDRIST